MFRPTSACLSALTKRTKKVRVQILKDFPSFQLKKGQVLQVKPSLMRNYLHNYNGAKYILDESDIDAVMLHDYTVVQQELEARQALIAQKTHQIETQKKEQQPKLTKNVQKQEKKNVINRGITIKDVFIPGLDL